MFAKVNVHGKSTKGTLHGRVYLPNNCKDCGVWFAEKPDGGVASHEALHLATHILTRSGLTFSGSSEEAWCYHVQWIVNKIGAKIW